MLHLSLRGNPTQVYPEGDQYQLMAGRQPRGGYYRMVIDENCDKQTQLYRDLSRVYIQSKIYPV